MRAIAVLSVMMWHAGIPGLRGGFVGVDVFFVISGFLMTSLLLGDVQQLGRVQILSFYARRIRRLLPAAATALAGTALITLLVLPPIRWADTAGDITAAALYVVNWRFADQAADYLQQGSAPSPVLHFWSLSVEEQFYLVLPILMALVCLVVATGRLRRAAIGAVVLAGGIASFAFCVHYTDAEPARAYFVTTTRAWELALGGAVALGAPRLRRVNAAAAAALGWLGLAAVITAVVTFDGSMTFPGTAAALPTVGTAAVIAGGLGRAGHGPVLVLRARPLQVIGALSYSLYLWHWPFLVGARVLFGDRNGDLSAGVALAVLAASAIPAWLSFRFVEERWRRPRSTARIGQSAVILLVACTAISLVSSSGVRILADQATADARSAVPTVPVLLPGTSVGSSTPGSQFTGSDATTSGATSGAGGPAASHSGTGTSPTEGSTASAAPVALGAQVLAADPQGDPHGVPVDSVPFMTPSAIDAHNDLPEVYAEGCHLDVDEVLAKSCTFGDPQSATVVAVVGDSHAAQWIPALQVIANQRDWKLVTYTKSSCPLNTALIALATGKPYTACQTWVANTMAELARIRPAMVITSSYSDYQALDAQGKPLPTATSVSVMAAGFRSTWATLGERGVRIEVLADTWASGFDIADCVSQNPTHLTRCAFDRAEAERPDAQLIALTRPLAAARVINLNTAVCPTAHCAPVIGGVLVYRDNSHLTKTYVLTLAPRLAAALPPG